MPPRTATQTDSRLAARFAAIASLGAAVIHFAVAPTHWHEWMPSGLFFVALALVQLVWAAVILVRTTIPVLAVGILLNVGVVALWAVSRTAGAPFGPHAGTPELTQAADLCALLLQIYVVMGAGWVLYRGRRGLPIHGFAHGVVLLGAAAVVALASTVGVASGLRHGHAGPAGAESGHHGPGVEPIADHHGDEQPRPAPVPVADPPAAAVPLHDAHGEHHHD